SSRPVAMRPATASVGLVSPRSTCDSIGADTPLRSARSRKDRSMASRRARTLGPTAIGSAAEVAMALYAITYARLLTGVGPAARTDADLRHGGAERERSDGRLQHHAQLVLSRR